MSPASATVRCLCVFSFPHSLRNHITFGCFFFSLFDCFVFRFAGTAGAILTCPLEVLKTRLQSSSSTFYPMPMSDAANKLNSNGSRLKRSSQTRDICTSILQKRSQVSVPVSVIGLPLSFALRNIIMQLFFYLFFFLFIAIMVIISASIP